MTPDAYEEATLTCVRTWLCLRANELTSWGGTPAAGSRMFCMLGSSHDNLVFAKDETEALVGNRLSVQSRKLSGMKEVASRTSLPYKLLQFSVKIKVRLNCTLKIIPTVPYLIQPTYATMLAAFLSLRDHFDRDLFDLTSATLDC